MTRGSSRPFHHGLIDDHDGGRVPSLLPTGHTRLQPWLHGIEPRREVVGTHCVLLQHPLNLCCQLIIPTQPIPTIPTILPILPSIPVTLIVARTFGGSSAVGRGARHVSLHRPLRPRLFSWGLAKEAQVRLSTGLFFHCKAIKQNINKYTLNCINIKQYN